MEPANGRRRGGASHPLRERAHARPVILAAARQLFKTESYSTVSSERIAASAGVTRHTLNNHFASKDEIFKLSREALFAEVAELMVDSVPLRMGTHEGVIFFLDHAFSVLSSDANLELMISVIRDGGEQRWMVDTHQRKVRGRLTQICETFLLYHVDRSDEMFTDIKVVAEQLISLAEHVAYGPYLDCKGNGTRSRSLRVKHFALAARAVSAMLANENERVARISPIQLEREAAQRVARG